MENEQSSRMTRRRFLVAAGAVVALLFLASAVAQADAASVSVSASPIVAHTSPGYVSFAVDLDQVTGGSFWSQAPNARGNVPVARYDFTRRRLRLLTRALAPA
jgi:hypothetical protein